MRNKAEWQRVIHGHDFKQPNYPAVYLVIIKSLLNPRAEILSMRPKEKLNNEILWQTAGYAFFLFLYSVPGYARSSRS